MVKSYFLRAAGRLRLVSHRTFSLKNGLWALLALFLTGCTAAVGFPVGPTPIPTLIPATEPAGSLAEPTAQVFTVQSYPARLPSATLGEKIYQDNCARCHGVDGKGVVPGARNFEDLDYMRGETPAYFYTAVTEGRGEMPSFRDSLTSDDRWDVVFYVWRFSTTAENLALGKNIYETNCAACHGADGTGKVLGAADFTDPHLVDGLAPRDFYLIVTQGKGSMPAWQGRLIQDERWAVIDYLRTFTYDPGQPAEAAGTPEATATTAAEATTTTTAEATCDQSVLSQTNPFAWDDSDAIAAGQAIYTQSCAICHGLDGAGALPGTPDFTAADAQSELHDHAGEFLCVLAEGRDGMPGWKETLTEDQMWQVLTYLGTLGK